METELLTVQQSEEMQKTSGNPSPFSEEELKEFYLKFARLVNPNACSANRNDFEVLSILRKDLKKNLGMLLIYLVIFFAIAIALQASARKEHLGTFEKTRINVAVADRDQSELSRGLI